VPGDGWLRKFGELRAQLAGGSVANPQQVQNLAALWVRKSREHNVAARLGLWHFAYDQALAEGS